MAQQIANRFCSVAAILLMLLLCRGWSQQTCNLNNIQYGVTRTGREVSGQTEWEVTITHTCNCSMGNIVFGNCKNFRTTEPVDAAIFQKTGDTCLVKQGQFLKPAETVKFDYAWNSPVIFVPSQADVRC